MPAFGQKDAAIRQGRRACELLPGFKDTMDSATMMVNLRRSTHEPERKTSRLPQVKAAISVPGKLSYGFLKLDPM